MNRNNPLDGVETYTPQLTPQEQVTEALVDFQAARIGRLERVMLAAQLYAGQGDARTAYAILSQALTGL